MSKTGVPAAVGSTGPGSGPAADVSDAGAADAGASDAGAGAGADAGADAAGADIRIRIDSGYGTLSPQEQRAADFILDHLDDLAVYSATEIALRSGVSKATVSRLFRTLGFRDAQEVREQARSSRNRGVPVGAPAAATGGLARLLAHESANLEAMLAGLAGGRLEAASALVASAREVVVIGLRNSYPVALHLRQQLAQVRDTVRLAPQPGQSLGEELAGLGRSDAVVLVGFRRRPAGFAALLSSLVARGVPVVLVTETSGPESAVPLVRLVCPVGSTGPFDSYAAAMSLATVLASAVLEAASRLGRTRVSEITSLYDELGEVEM